MFLLLQPPSSFEIGVRALFYQPSEDQRCLGGSCSLCSALSSTSTTRSSSQCSGHPTCCCWWLKVYSAVFIECDCTKQQHLKINYINQSSRKQQQHHSPAAAHMKSVPDASHKCKDACLESTAACHMVCNSDPLSEWHGSALQHRKGHFCWLNKQLK